MAILGTTGIARVTFAEFSPLFDADGLRLDGSGLVGTQDTWGYEAAATGLYRGFSLSVGQFHYETDGFHANNDLTHDIFNAVSTVALNPEFTLFGEYRHRETEGGDRRLRFEINDFDPTFRSEVERETARVGFHAQPSNNSDLIGVYTWADLSIDDRTSDPIFGDLITIIEEDAQSVQLQYLRHDGPLRTVIGGAYMQSNLRRETDFFGFFTNVESANVGYYNGYAYFHFNLPQQVTWIGGGSVVNYQRSNGEPEIFQFHPKIGARWELNDDITIRASYLRNLKPSRVSEQLIEPSTIAGFNQFYESFDGSVVDQVGGRIDVMLSKHSWIGGEAIGRWWDVVVIDAPNAETKEQLYRGYVYLTLWDKFALSAEFLHEMSSSDAPFDFEKWQTTSLPVTLSYFGETGLFGSVGIELVDHKFKDPGIGGSDEFVVVGAAIGYRLPNNAGIISVEVQNLFDEDFQFQNRTLRPDLTAAPRYAPERTLLARGTIKF